MQAAASQKRLWGAHCRKAFAEGGQYLRTMRSASAFGFHIVSIESSKPRNWTKNGSAHEWLKLRSGDFCSSKLSFHGWWFSVCDIVVAMCFGVILLGKVRASVEVLTQEAAVYCIFCSPTSWTLCRSLKSLEQKCWARACHLKNLTHGRWSL